MLVRALLARGAVLFCGNANGVPRPAGDAQESRHACIREQRCRRGLLRVSKKCAYTHHVVLNDTRAHRQRSAAYGSQHARLEAGVGGQQQHSDASQRVPTIRMK